MWIGPAAGARTSGELAGDHAEEGLLFGGGEVGGVTGDGVGFGEEPDGEAVVVPIGHERLAGGQIGGAAGGGESVGVLGEFVVVEHGDPAFGVVELKTAVAEVIDGPAVFHDAVELAGTLGAGEKIGADLHGAVGGRRARGGEREKSGAGLRLGPLEENGGVPREGEAALGAVELGAGGGDSAGEDGGGGAEGLGELGRIEADAPPDKFFKALEVRDETRLGFGGRQPARACSDQRPRARRRGRRGSAQRPRRSCGWLRGPRP